MEPPTPADKAKPKVDEQVVRKMLKVNPAMRNGRTTQQVKRALERGESLVAPENPEVPTPAASNDPARELEHTLAFFLRSKAEALGRTLADLEAQRCKLVLQEQRERAMRRAEIIAFVALLDRDTVARHGAHALATQSAALATLGLTTGELLDAVEHNHRGKR